MNTRANTAQTLLELLGIPVPRGTPGWRRAVGPLPARSEEPTPYRLEGRLPPLAELGWTGPWYDRTPPPTPQPWSPGRLTPNKHIAPGRPT